MNITIDEALIIINEELLNQKPSSYRIERKDHYPKIRENDVLASLGCLGTELKKSGIVPFQDAGYLHLLRLAEQKFEVEFHFGGMKLPKEV
ncbi:hypothetical protein RG959_19100 [Domibacillus sp. 8LH]|uniref:hypothetical protein n=1 Tax=unclassified Domibacillus TaxID=2632383 RepID=UPI0028EDAE10|nr:hypothetical protein [Domibacillus sp. DTU_2020_1001157_1_SI_ALB_TIR_016]WNS78294.1 hypothetical protein RRU94_07495 [Domibacillus sp. DTU_2020_1001157_1_SI_ALB_TIR_016]